MDDLSALMIYLDEIITELGVMAIEYNTSEDNTLADVIKTALANWEKQITIKDQEHKDTMQLVNYCCTAIRYWRSEKLNPGRYDTQSEEVEA